MKVSTKDGAISAFSNSSSLPFTDKLSNFEVTRAWTIIMHDDCCDKEPIYMYKGISEGISL